MTHALTPRTHSPRRRTSTAWACRTQRLHPRSHTPVRWGGRGMRVITAHAHATQTGTGNSCSSESFGGPNTHLAKQVNHHSVACKNNRTATYQDPPHHHPQVTASTAKGAITHMTTWRERGCLHTQRGTRPRTVKQAGGAEPQARRAALVLLGLPAPVGRGRATMLTALSAPRHTHIHTHTNAIAELWTSPLDSAPHSTRQAGNLNQRQGDGHRANHVRMHQGSQH